MDGICCTLNTITIIQTEKRALDDAALRGPRMSHTSHITSVSHEWQCGVCMASNSGVVGSCSHPSLAVPLMSSTTSSTLADAGNRLMLHVTADGFLGSVCWSRWLTTELDADAHASFFKRSILSFLLPPFSPSGGSSCFQVSSVVKAEVYTGVSASTL